MNNKNIVLVIGYLTIMYLTIKGVLILFSKIL